MVATPFTIPEADEHDIPTLARHRIEMFREVFPRIPRFELRRIRSATVQALGSMMSHCQGACLGWVAQDAEGQIIGSSMLVFHRCLPRPDCVSGLDAEIAQIYVRPLHRRIGVATALMRAAVDCGKKRGFRRPTAFLNPAAAPLLNRFGFTASDARVRIAE